MTRMIKIFFTLSILFNIALGGVIAGHMYRQFKHSDFGEMHDQELHDEELSPETRKVMRKVYREKRTEIWSLREDMRKKKQALKKTITGETFDEEAFKKAANNLKGQNEKAYDSRVNSFVKVLSKLPKPERDKMAQRAVDILAGHRNWDRSPDREKQGPPDKNNPFKEEDQVRDGNKQDKKNPKDKKSKE